MSLCIIWDLHVYHLRWPFPISRGIPDHFPEPGPLPSDIDDTPFDTPRFPKKKKKKTNVLGRYSYKVEIDEIIPKYLTKSSESSTSFFLSLWSSFFFSTGGATDVCIIKATKNSRRYCIFLELSKNKDINLHSSFRQAIRPMSVLLKLLKIMVASTTFFWD